MSLQNSTRGEQVSFIFSCPLLVPSTDTCDLVCLNGGSCFLNARKQPKCRCQPRYNGDRCQSDQCADYCQNGGTCAASNSGKQRKGKSWMSFGSGDPLHPQLSPQLLGMDFCTVVIVYALKRYLQDPTCYLLVTDFRTH